MLACSVRWLLKASAQKVLGAAPGGRSANYLLQRHVARSLPRGEAAFTRKFRRALRHLDAYSTHGAREPSDARFYEFGPGWDLVVALAFRALGIERQTLVDVAAVARTELVNDSLAKLGRLEADLAAESGRSLRALGPELRSLDELEERFGITYVAPQDPSDTGLPSASFDFVSSTSTLEHVPADDIGPLLAECRRLLTAEGVMSCTIDLRDHFSFMDGRISPYNFLRFDTRRWRLLGSPLNYQNRLRYPDYLELFRSAGFEMLEEHAVEPSARDLDVLRGLDLAEPFSSRYSLQELGVKQLRFVVRPVHSPDAQ
jgi:SAM-dependent methyltransferase